MSNVASQPSTKKREYTKTPLMEHQRLGLRKGYGRAAFANLCEQGTGKSLMILAEALALYDEGEIDALVILAPNGAHIGWIVEQCEYHIPPEVDAVAAYYTNHPTRRERAALACVNGIEKKRRQPFRVLSVSYDAICTEQGFRWVLAFTGKFRCMIDADESQKIKSPQAIRTKRALKIRAKCPYRRISTGTLMDKPMDVYSQFEFLEQGLLGESAYASFVAQYCVLINQQHGVMKHIRQRIERGMKRALTDKEWAMRAPPLIAQDELGRNKYKNLDQLQERIAEHSYRVLKEQVLDLPPKTYKTLYFKLTPAQRTVYDRMEEEMRYVLDDGSLLMVPRLVALGKLRQITSGFLILRDGTVSYIEDNPRIELLHDSIEDETRAGVIWSQYKEEQRNIERMIKTLGQTVETVNGDTKMKRRKEIRDEFQAGNLQWISAHPQTMGEYFTLTAGKIVYYYSNGFAMIERVQSEDRTHRIGTVGESVPYRDLCAVETRDENVVWALQHKLDTAAMITGDPARPSRFGRG